jgi:beta-lactamase regulating signal transducer with metallopeptidase domain
MGELVNVLNTAGGAFVTWAGPMLIQSSVLIIILAALDLALRKRVKAVVRYWIWLLVLVKLLLPPAFSAPTGLAYWVGGKLPVWPARVAPVARAPQAVSLPDGGSVVASTPPTVDSGPLAGPVSKGPALLSVERRAPMSPTIAPNVPITWPALALLAWAAVVIGMAVVLIQRALFVRGLVAQSREPPPEIAELLGRCGRRLGVRGNLAVRLSPLSASPSVCGLRRPVILIPEEMLARLQANELESVLLHELAHVKRGDLWLNLVQALLQVMYFYHPLLWAANAWIRRVREQAVDETVLAALGEEAEDYPRTLLSVSRLAFGQPALSLRLLGVVESRKALMDRIRHIASRPFPRTAGLGFTGCVLVLVIAVTLLPMASAAPQKAKTEGAPQTAALPVPGADAVAGQITLSGRVIDGQGKPLAGAEVTLYQLTAGELGVLSKVEAIDRKTTGADGAFAFAVAPGTKSYREGRVIARKEGLALAWAAWPMMENQRLDLRLGEPKELAGDVVDEAGRPIAEADIHIAMAKIGRGEDRRELWPTGFLKTTTDRNGHFVFADMPAGATFEFRVEGPGRATIHTLDMSSYSREQCQFAPGQTGIRLTLPVEARIEGVVVEKAGGKPVGGIEVRAHEDWRRSAPLPSKRAVTAPDGTFHIGSLAAGSCVLELVTARGQMPEWVAEDVQTSLQAGETTSGLRMHLTKGAIVEVLIKDTAGKPVEKVGTYLRRVGQEQGFGSTTDESGLARIRVIPGGYSVSQIFRPGYAPPETTDPVTIAEGETKRVEYIVTPKPKVTGIVRDEAGNPLAGVKVQATWIRMMSSVTGGAVSDASGKFDFPWDTSSLARGASTAIFVARDAARNLVQVLDIDEQTGPLDLKLKPGVIVTGTVLDQAGGPLPGANARVLVRVDRTPVRLSWDELAAAGPDGVFEVKAVPPEREYTVEVTADGYGKQAVPIASLGPQEKHHDIGQVKLTASNLPVAGVVVDPNDQPVAGVEVSAYGEGQPDLRSVQTDAQGRFTMKGVCPGSIHLIVNPRGQSRLYGSAQAEAGATEVKITVAERRMPQAYPPRRGAVLKGKPLPPLKDLGIDLPADAAGKMLLVCFWDMGQRPSRSCLTQLAAQATTLGQKGVEIVAVHAAKVEGDALSQWLKENKVPFTAAAIAGDINKTKLAWGVASLPHLILTDKKHVVVAEGFGLTELDKQVAALTGQ